MRLSTTLSAYIARNFLQTFLVLFGLFLMLIFLFDTVELLRRAAAKPDITFSLVVEMALLKLPHMGQQAFPFAILFGGMAAFWRLARTHELVITRAAGVSVWQFLLPVLGIAFLLGLIQIGVLNPLASTTITRYERIEAVNLKGQKSFLALSKNGLWLRQANADGQSVVHSRFVLQTGKDVELRDVVVFNYKENDQFVGRLDAEKASLEDGFWHLTNAWVHTPEETHRLEKDFWLATDLTLNRIQDSFAPPETMSFWDLPGFIQTLEKAGFTAVRHRLYWHSLLASPLLMCAMVLIAATFTLRHARQGGGSYVIGGGVLTGFVLYFFSDIVFALGLSDSIPATLAAWTPAGVATLLGLATLLHLEDG
ncbi:MAG: LPS export ABC transporter permease LptG [Alphaproteobacteria bacterium]|nr:LPS export ABC transporter permease LptG [Alphaproteobacteria bacterium]MBT7943240.1 LPS export ABC transporter permease LptG [Alphaproteobacteria bacterium]